MTRDIVHLLALVGAWTVLRGLWARYREAVARAIVRRDIARAERLMADLATFERTIARSSRTTAVHRRYDA